MQDNAFSLERAADLTHEAAPTTAPDCAKQRRQKQTYCKSRNIALMHVGMQMHDIMMFQETKRGMSMKNTLSYALDHALYIRYNLARLRWACDGSEIFATAAKALQWPCNGCKTASQSCNGSEMALRRRRLKSCDSLAILF